MEARVQYVRERSDGLSGVLTFGEDGQPRGELDEAVKGQENADGSVTPLSAGRCTIPGIVEHGTRLQQFLLCVDPSQISLPGF